MQPCDSGFHSDRAGQKVGVVPDQASCLLRRHAFDGKVSGLSEDVAGKVDLALGPYQLAAVASQAALVCPGVVARHGRLEYVAAYYEQAGKVVRVQELPGAFAPCAMRVVAYQLGNLEVFMKLSYELVTRLSHLRPPRL